MTTQEEEQGLASPPKHPPRSVLIVKLSAIGDVIHALPVASELRRLLPDARIGWLVEELSAPLLDNHPCIDKLYIVPRKRWRKESRMSMLREVGPFFRAIRSDGWECAIDLQGLTKSGLAALGSGAPLRVGFGDADMRELNRFLTNRKVVPPTGLHKVEHNLSLLRGLGLEPNLAAPGTIGLREEERDTQRRRLVEAGMPSDARALALNPGAGWASKRWKPENFAVVGTELARRHGLHPVVVWGPGEEPLRDVIAERLEASKTPFTVAPPTRIRELAAMLSLCALFVGGDTGPTHMASLLGVPTVGVFGASDGVRNGPWPRTGGRMVQRTELDCVPCWDTKCALRGERHMACLLGLGTETVVNAASELLEASGTETGAPKAPATL